MSSGSRSPVNRPVLIGYCLILVCAAVAVLCTATASKAEAAYYKMVLCGADNGAGQANINTNVDYFVFQNQCGGPNFPAGSGNFMRLYERQGPGSAWPATYASVSWTAPSFVTIAGGGGYTRQENDFADGWRARFWGEGQDGGTNNFLMQGSGVPNNSLGGVGWARTTVFTSHLWPFATYGNYRRFVFEMTCFRQAGCDTGGFNNTDANSIVLTLNDMEPSNVGFTNTSSGILSGNWVRGTQNVTWKTSERGSGIRFDRLRVDGGTRQEVDSRPWCDLGSNGATGEFGRQFQPCPTGSWDRSYGFDTASVSDGGHTVQVCTQDYGQAVGLNGTGGESCDQRGVKVDNHAPAAPGGLAILTSNPERYLDHFGARWTLPSDPGSPVRKVHYDVVDITGKTVVPERVVSATNPTKLDDIAGPKAAGDYRLRVWLEDEVGFSGPAATVPIPHDTTPPAAPQEIAVASPTTSRGDQGFDVRWRNITDAGAPIDALHYQLLDAAGNALGAAKELHGDNPQSIASLDAPKGRGDFKLKLWLSDAEGNVGAPSEAPLAYDCVRSDVGGGQALGVGIGENGERVSIVSQGEGPKLTGELRGSGGPVEGASLCIYSRVITDGGRDFLGVAMTSGGGRFAFPLGAGPSRELSAIYRPDQRQIEASASALTRVVPTLRLRKRTVRNGHKAWFSGEVPGPHNDGVLIVLQVESGRDKWRAFRRYRTREGGRFKVAYRFTQTRSATTYPIRAQVRQEGGFPYEPGNSPTVRLRVRP
jgi:hypothetical protein